MCEKEDPRVRAGRRCAPRTNADNVRWESERASELAARVIDASVVVGGLTKGSRARLQLRLVIAEADGRADALAAAIVAASLALADAGVDLIGLTAAARSPDDPSATLVDPPGAPGRPRVVAAVLCASDDAAVATAVHAVTAPRPTAGKAGGLFGRAGLERLAATAIRTAKETVYPAMADALRRPVPSPEAELLSVVDDDVLATLLPGGDSSPGHPYPSRSRGSGAASSGVAASEAPATSSAPSASS